MNPQSKAREYFLADSHLRTETGQEFRIAGTFPESGMVTGSYIHVIEHSAFVRLQDELEYTKRLLADERSGDCDKDKTIRRLERNLNNALSENAILRELVNKARSLIEIDNVFGVGVEWTNFRHWANEVDQALEKVRSES